MIDFEILRSAPESIQKELKKRGIKDVSLKDILVLDEKRRNAISKYEKIRAEQKAISDQIAKATPVQRKKLITGAKKLADKLKKEEPGLRKIETEFLAAAAGLPNLSHKSVPAGQSSSENEIVATYNEKPVFDFKPKPHWQLAEQNGTLDSKRAAKVSGSRFNYIMGDLVRLEFALLQYALDELVQKGFTPMLTPTLVKENAMYGSGMFPLDRQEVYKLADDDLYLIGTSEIALLNFHSKESIDIASRPLKYTGFTTNYRREAGTYGKEMRGLIRVHQFDKLEMFVFVSQEQSWDIFENELVGIAEGLLKKLGLHFRKVILSAGDLPRKFQKTYDLEVWLPSEERYLETHSISHAGDYQSRRLSIKYKTKDGQRRYAHTLNATAFAFSRMPVVIMENFQQADGKILIPEVLQSYMNNQEYIQ